MSKGVCPCCNGTKRVPVPEASKRYKSVISGYNAETDTLPCHNCGGQYMFGQPTGEVKLNKDGVPCTHSYTSENKGRCYNLYTCVHCGDNFTIDSSD